MRVLVVEDDRALCGLMTDYLVELGHETIRTCHTAHEARETVDNQRFDCAFVDLKLQGANGIELLAGLKESNPTLILVMMTGFPTMECTIEAMRRGASDFLTKPFTFQDLAVCLERVTRERGLLLENLSLQFERRTREQLEDLNRELQDRVYEQTRLFEISSTIDQIGSSEELYPRMVEMAMNLTAASKTGFFVLPPEQESLILIADKAREGHHANRIQKARMECLSRLFDSGDNHMRLPAGDLFAAENGDGWAAAAENVHCWPFRIRGEHFGVLVASHNGGADGVTGSELNLLDFLVKKASLAIENMALYDGMVSSFYGILKTLAQALEAKDTYTARHSERVTFFASKIGRHMGCPENEISTIENMGHLHDIGKIGIPGSILNKPGRLTDEEYRRVQMHPAIGESIIAELGLSDAERAVVRHHHESWDGKGYPDKLAGRDIPLVARIVTVADSYDAMTSARAYRAAMTREQAFEELMRCRGRQFDPDIVGVFLESFKNEDPSR